MAASSFQDVERAFLAVIAARELHGGSAHDEDEVLRACGDDAAMAAEVRSLLRHYDRVREDDDSSVSSSRHAEQTTVIRFLDPAELHTDRRRAPAADHHAALDDWGAYPVGQRVGEFTLIGERGSGGMGVVFVAEQERPRRKVALKLVRRHAATPALLRRFDREAQLLARLNHPGIAQVYAAGMAELATAASAGAVARVPYIAMEWVDGPNLLEFVRARPHDGSLVLRLVAQVCDAVQHAHVRGVIHRDLKPPNILVATGADGAPQVKVLDFGVARGSDEGAGDVEAGAATRFTDHGLIVGTLSYMSPEQVRSGTDVDARTDVYAIGAILYQLLSGALPVDVRDCPLPDAARRIVEREAAPLGAVNRSFRGDVETIVSTALHKDPARRYQSPAELARDIRHHLAGEPIQARRDSLVYLLGKRAARYRTIALAAAALLLVVTAAAIYARQQQRAAVWAAEVAHAARSQAATAQASAERAASRLATELSASRIEQGRLLGAAGDLTGAERLLWDEYFADPQQRSVRWALWELYSKSGCLRTIAAHSSECRTLALTSDGLRVATGGDDSKVRVWSVEDGQQLAEIDTGLASVRAVDFTADGSRVAVAGDGGAVKLDIANGTREPLGDAHGAAHGVDVSSDGFAVAVGYDDGSVRLYDPTSGTLLASDSGAVPLRAVRFDPSCTRLAAAYLDGTVRLWNVKLAHSSAELTPGPHVAGRPGTTGYSVDFSPDGKLLATGSSDRTLSLWRSEDGQLVRTIETGNGSARSAAFSPDGRHVAVPGFWRTKLFDVATGQHVQSSRMPALGSGGGHAAAFTSDGRTLIATGPAGTCRMWDLSADPATELRSTASPVRDLTVARVGDTCVLASIQSDGELRVRTKHLDASNAPRNGAAAWRDALRCNVGTGAQTLAITPDARRIVIGRADGHLLTVDASTGQVVQDVAAHRESVNVVKLTANGRTLVSGGSDDVVHLWRPHTGGEGWEQAGQLECGGDVVGAALHPDGTTLATTARPGCLQLWELPGGRSLGQVRMPEMPWRLAYSPDGNRIAAGSWDRSVQLWSRSGNALMPLRLEMALLGHDQLVINEAFDASGELLASVSNDGSLRIWDVSPIENNDALPRPLDHRRCLVTLDAGAGDSLSVAFLPRAGGDALPVAVGYYDGTVRVWDLGYFNRHISGQLDHQRRLRNLPTITPNEPPARR